MRPILHAFDKGSNPNRKGATVLYTENCADVLKQGISFNQRMINLCKRLPPCGCIITTPLKVPQSVNPGDSHLVRKHRNLGEL